MIQKVLATAPVAPVVQLVWVNRRLADPVVAVQAVQAVQAVEAAVEKVKPALLMA